jgi:UDPglucose 6-dehydrogenase
MLIISIIGMGFVGNAVAEGFQDYVVIQKYDIDDSKRTHFFKECTNSDFVFICLPTPMVSAEGGECNLSIIEDFFYNANLSNENKETIFIIKSTVPVGTTRRLGEKYPRLKIVHNPEFLTARNANWDFVNPERNIVGGQNKEAVEKVANLLRNRFSKVPCHTMFSDESEMVKYMANCFLGVKVSFFNEMKLLVDKLNLDWNHVLEGVLADSRIGRSHTQVPGPDGDLGYGGSCVLPAAEVCIIERKNSTNVNLQKKILTIEDLYNKNVTQKSFTFIESCDGEFKDIEFKQIKKVTKRKVNEDILVFNTENGIFECTKDHLMPVERDRKIIIIPAKKIKETDKFFSK